MGPTTIPIDVDGVTPEWLSDALATDVTAVEVLDRHSGTTGRARIGLTYGADTDAHPSTMFVKLAPFDERQRRFVDAVGLGLAEARFYAEVAPEVPVRVPRSHHAAFDDDGRYIMVMEDLVASGCRFPSLRDADLAETTGSIVDELARLHVRWWESPALSTSLAWTAQGLRLAFGGGGPFVRKAVDRFADEMPPVFRRIGELYCAEAPRIAQLFEV
ncbi:MAG: ecdysteroid 22-kinase family protein, partial [Actinobacteria bacterium]|nr:ecdysteroid 22-kinase family protein [Actinomycetota bacterium]